MSDLPGGDRSAAAARRSHLNGIRLRALVAEHLGEEGVAAAEQFAPGAALVHDDRAWVYLDERPADRLGAAMAWALRKQAAALNVVAASGTGQLARRASQFATPISVWHADERNLWPAVAEPVVTPEPAPEHHRRFVEVMAAAGVEPVEEHGVLAGEVLGLEVCRVVDDRFTSTTRLEVGVGAHDREAFTMLHGDEPTPEALARVAEVVRSHRRLDAPPHPLNRFGRERLLRSMLIADPGVVGAVRLSPAQPPVPRPNLKDPVPCVATGATPDGTPLVVVCSTGVELDLIPYAADGRLAVATLEPEGDQPWQLVVVTPKRDRLAVTEALAAQLREPAWLVSLD